jgi:hypothetical protein
MACNYSALHAWPCRYGLAIGYYCSWLVRGLMVLTSPISWPLGRLLDRMLGSEHTALYRWAGPAQRLGCKGPRQVMRSIDSSGCSSCSGFCDM